VADVIDVTIVIGVIGVIGVTIVKLSSFGLIQKKQKIKALFLF